MEHKAIRHAAGAHAVAARRSASVLRCVRTLCARCSPGRAGWPVRCPRSPPTTAFTFTGGVYQILTVPSSTFSLATGINGAGLIVGVYEDLSGVLRGFANNGGTFSNVDFPGATGTQAIGVNDAGQIVGAYFDAAGVQHGFVSSGGTFTGIDFPGATGTAAAGINAAGDIVGVWSDATGSHGFRLQAGVFTPSTFRSPPAPPPLASATPGRSPASTTTPPATLTASSTPAGPSAPWTPPAPAAPN